MSYVNESKLWKRSRSTFPSNTQPHGEAEVSIMKQARINLSFVIVFDYNAGCNFPTVREHLLKANTITTSW